MIKKLSPFLILIIVGCTVGRLQYITPAGETKFACEIEYSWAPAVDKYAVEYILSRCAKQAKEAGNKIVDQRLLTIDTSIPEPPDGKVWSYELATEEYRAGNLSDKEYGYIIAFVDLGLSN